MEKYTVESLFDGRLTLRQPENGYRHTVDPILLCDHARPEPGGKILDMGCGCGIIPLVMGVRHPHARIFGVEIQQEMADLAAANVRINQMESHIQIIHKDISTLTAGHTGGRFDLILSNPPYKKAGTGRLNPDPQKAIARHEVKLTIATLFQQADKLLKPSGRIQIIFPAERVFDLYQAMMSTPIRPEWIRFIHTSPKKNALRIILSATKNTQSSCRVHPPFYLYDAQDIPTKEHKSIFYA